MKSYINCFRFSILRVGSCLTRLARELLASEIACQILPLYLVMYQPLLSLLSELEKEMGNREVEEDRRVVG